MKELMLGNDAVARGLFEAGVRYVSSYPGTPSTEITERVALYPEVYAEWAPNEKVALESALGASIAAAEKRGFGVHALEVWQKSSHVKHTGECHRRQSQTPERFRYMLTGPRLFLKCSLSKNIWQKIFCLILERGVPSLSSHG